jgi:hypothetical protein
VKPFELYISYISWGTGGKRRPVLVFSRKDATVFVYAITSRYENKPESIRVKYFRIHDWQQAGLGKPSYIDTGTYFPISAASFAHKPIGRLTVEDKERLIGFLSRR